MAAFYGNSEYVVNHINNNKKDNRLKNLEYVTQSDNIRKFSKRKLSDDDILEIKLLKSSGVNRRIIAEMFNITKCYVNTICREQKIEWK